MNASSLATKRQFNTDHQPGPGRAVKGFHKGVAVGQQHGGVPDGGADNTQISGQCELPLELGLGERARRLSPYR